MRALAIIFPIYLLACYAIVDALMPAKTNYPTPDDNEPEPAAVLDDMTNDLIGWDYELHSMSEYDLRRELARAELECRRQWADSSPAARMISMVKRTGSDKGHINKFTIGEYRTITGKGHAPILEADGRHVDWYYTLDYVTQEAGYEHYDRPAERLKDDIEAQYANHQRIKQLERVV